MRRFVVRYSKRYSDGWRLEEVLIDADMAEGAFQEARRRFRVWVIAGLVRVLSSGPAKVEGF